MRINEYDIEIIEEVLTNEWLELIQDDLIESKLTEEEFIAKNYLSLEQYKDKNFSRILNSYKD